MNKLIRYRYLVFTWYPRFIRNWADAGQLKAILAGHRAWCRQREALVPALCFDHRSLLTLRDWLQYAIYAGRRKKNELGIGNSEMKNYG